LILGSPIYIFFGSFLLWSFSIFLRLPENYPEKVPDNGAGRFDCDYSPAPLSLLWQGSEL